PGQPAGISGCIHGDRDLFRRSEQERGGGVAVKEHHGQAATSSGIRPEAASSSAGIREKRAGTRSLVLSDPPAPANHQSLAQRWVSFWFNPIDPVGLHALRVACGLLFLLWLLPLAGNVAELFGLYGWFDVYAYPEAARLPGGPPVPFGWSILYAVGAD